MATRALLLALALLLVPRTGSAAIQIVANYIGDGWTETRRETFDAAMLYLGGLFSPSYEGQVWVIDARFGQMESPAILADGNPTAILSLGLVNYVPALYNHIQGSTVYTGSVVDIIFNEDTDWNYATDPSDLTVDDISFYQTSIHEVLHGLGFASTLDENGSWTFGDPAEAYPMIYDQYLAWFDGENYIPLTELSQAERITAYTSNQLYWIGENAVAANHGVPVDIYAPYDPEPGSSIGHLSPLLDPNYSYMMYPYVLDDEIPVLTLSAIELGMLSDMGYNVVPEPRTLTLLTLAALAAIPLLRRRRAPLPLAR